MLLENFYEEVLEKLGVVAAEEAAHPADRAKVVSKYQEVHAEYAERELVPFFDDEDVPEKYVDPLSSIVAFRLTTKYAVSDKKYVRLGTAALEGDGVIVGFGQRRPVPRETAVYY